ncbi:MAG: EAL domain-containing protein [Pseudomonadota bacterium]
MQPQPAITLDLSELIAREGVTIHFQPLVTMRSQNVLAVEALARGVHPVTGELVPPGMLFCQAVSDQLLIDLDRLCRKKALEAFRELRIHQPNLVLSLNFEAALLDKGVVGSGVLLHQVQEAGLEPNTVIIEIVESRVSDTVALERFVNQHRDYGFLLALDDLGSGHSNLERIALIQPDVLKIDRSLISGLERHYYKQEVTRSILNLAGKIGALVVAEGVEREEEALLALEMGVDILQGFYLSYPGPGLERMAGCQRRIGQLAARYRGYTVQKIAAKKAKHRVYDEVVQILAKSLSGCTRQEIDERLAELIGVHPALECLYVLDAEGRQISETVCEARKLASQRRRIFWPAARGQDQSLKNYYLLLKAGLEKYTSDPYISLASGNLCITISTWFQGQDGARYVLCTDFDADLSPADDGGDHRPG